MCRIGESNHETGLQKEFVIPIDFTGSPLKGICTLYKLAWKGPRN